MYDPDVWSEFKFDNANIIISCMIGGQEAELGIARWLKERNANIPMIAATDSSVEAIELYKAGMRFVIQTEYLAAKEFERIFEKEISRGKEAFLEIGKKHSKELLDFQSRHSKRIFLNL